jgi:hypothetical protein
VQNAELGLASPPESLWRGRAKRAAIVALAISPVLAAVGFQLPVCPSAGLMGVPCPGCGLTRATLAALQGHFSEAFTLHPLFALLTPVYLGLTAAASWAYIRGPVPPSPKRGWDGKLFGIFLIVVLALMIGVWFLRFFGLFGGPVPIESAWR